MGGPNHLEACALTGFAFDASCGLGRLCRPPLPTGSQASYIATHGSKNEQGKSCIPFLSHPQVSNCVSLAPDSKGEDINPVSVGGVSK